MLVDGDQSSNSDKKLPVLPADQPPPYVFYATTPEVQAAVDPTPIASASAPIRSKSQEPIPPFPPFVTPPANFVSIQEVHSAIKGSWTIDTTQAPPPAFLRASAPSLSPPPTPGFFQRLMSFSTDRTEKYPGPTPNLKLESTHGRVEANVRVVRGSSDLVPARLDLRSTHGAVQLNVMSRGSQRINVVALSTYGAIEVRLPRDFRGLVRHRTIYGKYAPSDAIVAQSTTFSVEKGVGRTFIGDWNSVDFSQIMENQQADDTDAAMASVMERMITQQSGAEGNRVPSSGSNDWPADMLTIDSTYGRLTIMYTDE